MWWNFLFLGVLLRLNGVWCTFPCFWGDSVLELMKWRCFVFGSIVFPFGLADYTRAGFAVRFEGVEVSVRGFCPESVEAFFEL